jgi:hypothetical protein
VARWFYMFLAVLCCLATSLLLWSKSKFWKELWNCTYRFKMKQCFVQQFRFLKGSLVDCKTIVKDSFGFKALQYLTPMFPYFLMYGWYIFWNQIYTSLSQNTMLLHTGWTCFFTKFLSFAHFVIVLFYCCWWIKLASRKPRGSSKTSF